MCIRTLVQKWTRDWLPTVIRAGTLGNQFGYHGLLNPVTNNVYKPHTHVGLRWWARCSTSHARSQMNIRRSATFYGFREHLNHPKEYSQTFCMQDKFSLFYRLHKVHELFNSESALFSELGTYTVDGELWLNICRGEFVRRIESGLVHRVVDCNFCCYKLQLHVDTCLYSDIVAI